MTRVQLLAIAGAMTLGFSASTAHAQAVQLPTFTQFTVSTSVMVPDSGGAQLGSVRRIREGSVSRGIPGMSKIPGLARLGKNRGIGRESSLSTLSAHATIISLSELDEMVLGAAAAARKPVDSKRALVEKKARTISRGLAGGSSKEPALRLGAGYTPSVAALKKRRSRAKEKQAAEALALLRRGEDAEARGKPNVAKIYYQMASRRADGPLKKFIAVRLEAVRGRRLAATGSGRSGG